MVQPAANATAANLNNQERKDASDVKAVKAALLLQTPSRHANAFANSAHIQAFHHQAY